MDINFKLPSYKREFALEVKRCLDTEDNIERIRKFVDKQSVISEQVLGRSLALDPVPDLATLDSIYDPLTSEHEAINFASFQENKQKSLAQLDSAFAEIKQDKENLELFMLTFDRLKGITARKGQEASAEQVSAESPISIISGVCLKKDELKLKLTLMRVTRGNSHIYFNNIIGNMSSDDSRMRQEEYICFVIVILGEKNGQTWTRCMRAVSAFEKVKIQHIPETDIGQENLQNEKIDEMKSKRRLFVDTFKLIFEECQEIVAHIGNTNSSKLELDLLFVHRQRGIYDTMNKFFVQGASLIAECWVPQIQLKDVADLVELKNLEQRKDLRAEAFGLINKMIKGEFQVLSQNLDENEKLECKPPTQFRMNGMVSVAQFITDTYGVPRQKEINPTLFNAITFPFEFGVMFGDILHGTLLFLIGILLCLLDSRLKLGDVKQMILQMGFWAMFMGWMYNDFTGLSIPLFNSCWQPNPPGGVIQNGIATPMAAYEDCVQPFGMDPMWDKSDQTILWFNSQKMKFAIIVGITQMTFGVFLKGLNNIYTRNWVDFFFEQIPQQIFITLFFGWFIVLIVQKWLQQSPTNDNTVNLIQTLINIPIAFGSATAGSTAVMDPTTQTTFQQVILLVSMGCVPVMLLVKPVVLLLQKHHKTVSINSIFPLVKEQAPHGFGELFIHQMIETIEFTLGCVSNTASQLRLWALSLAHAELSLTFVNQLFISTLGSSFVVTFVAFLIFMSVEIAVLMAMDQLECFLHALRLHWVEFQNKFQKADGYKFKPYSHDNFVVLNKQ